MQRSALKLLLMMLGLAGASGCAPQEQARTPDEAESDQAARQRHIDEEQRELARRRHQLETQVLSELRKLRESRQASTHGAASASQEPAGDYELLVFGGAIHEVFLGCLCDEKRPDSVFNMTGEHGSDLSDISIRNKFAPYGSNHDDTSACNAQATHPPLVVTSDGKSLGLLTLNETLERRITAPTVADWLARMCNF